MLSCGCTPGTSVQCNLAKGRIAILSPLAADPSCGGSRPHVIHSSLDPHESAPQTASRSVQPFLNSSPVCPTDRHTDHTTCIILSEVIEPIGGYITESVTHCWNDARPKLPFKPLNTVTAPWPAFISHFHFR